MREAGVDRGAFISEVWLPALKAVGLTRTDLIGYDRRAKEAAAAQA